MMGPVCRAESAASETLILVGMVAAWYASSMVCGWTSKLLLIEFKAMAGDESPNANFLSVLQFLGSAAIGFIIVKTRGLKTALPNAEASFKLWRVAAAFSFGFTFVNSTFAVTSVAMAETLRALEPVSTVVLGLCWLGEAMGTQRLLTLVPIVLGAALASASSTDFSWLGLGLAMMSNLCFSLRSVFVKDFKAATAGSPMDSMATFFTLVVRGVPMQLLTVGFLKLGSSLAIVQSTDFWTPNILGLAAVNAVCFFAYNCLSFLVLARVNVITHAVANGFRRAATIGFSCVVFAQMPSGLNAAGIALATTGVVLYAQATAKEKAAAPKASKSA